MACEGVACLSKKPYKTRKECEANINKYRLANGLTWAELAEKVGSYPGEISGLSSGIRSPVNSKGGISPTAQKLVAFFGVDFDELFPRYFCRIKPQEIELEFTGDIESFSDNENDYIEIGDLLEKIKNTKKITKRNKQALFMYFGLIGGRPHTYREIGEKLGISHEMARLHVMKSIRRLRREL